MKRFIVKLILFLLPVLILVASVNYFGDAGNLFSDIEVQIAEYMTEGYNVANVSNINERSLQRKIIALNKNTPSVIVLGSSKVMMLNHDYFKIGSFMNHGVPGASLEDMVAIYQMYKNKGVLPRKIIIGIDPWIFNENNGQDRWRTLDAEYSSFFSPDKIMQKSSFSFDHLFELFSPSYFQSSIRMLKTRLFDRETIKLLPTQTRNNAARTKLSDGSITYGLKHRNISLSDVEDKANDYISGSIYSLEEYSQFSPESLQLFDDFIAEITSNNIEVEFIMVPYHPVVYDFLASNNKYKIVVAFEQHIRKLALNRKILSTGSLDPSELRLNNSHFYDGMHLNEKGVDILLGKQESIIPENTLKL